MKGTDKTKRTKENNSQDRFYVGDIIKNKITNKVLKVAIVTLAVDGTGILFYALCDIDEEDETLLNRYIPAEAFDHWELVAPKFIQPDDNMHKKTTTIRKVITVDYTIVDINPEDGIVFDFTKFKNTRISHGMKFGKEESTCLNCDKSFQDGDRMYMVITDKGNFFVCKDCVAKLRREMGVKNYCKPENEHLNVSEKVPYFATVEDWVNSLPYDVPYNGKPDGYIYHNPLETPSRYGVKPEVVYERLFNENHYYGLTDKELTKLRTTIQYLCVHLDDFYDKVTEFLQKQGFTRYMKQGKRGDLIHSYFKRNNISLYVSNLEQVQDFRPNTFTVEISELVTSPKTGKKKRVQRMASFAHIPMPDEFGELTVESFENYLKQYITEIKE